MKLNFTKTTLKNGIRLILAPMKETDAVAIKIFFGAGSRYEEKEVNGTAHFLEHMAFKGTKKRPTTLDISKEIDSVGGSFNAFTSEETTGYWIYLPANKIKLGADILSDILINSKLEQKEINKEKGVILEEIKMYNDMPRYLASIHFQKLIFGDTPLGRDVAGKPETVKKITRQKLLHFYSRFYNPDNMVISICGNIPLQKTQKLIKEKFGKIKGKTNEQYEKNKIIQQKPQIKIVPKDTEQATMIMGFRSFKRNHKARYVRSLLANILGGYMSSKLFTEVREKRGLAYSIHSSVDAYHDTGTFIITGGFDLYKLPEAIKIIFKILNDAKKQGFKYSEIKMAKEHNIGKLDLLLENSQFIASFLGEQEILDNKIKTPEEIIKEIKKVTNSNIKKIAKEIFKPENFNMVIVGSIKKEEEKRYLELVKV